MSSASTQAVERQSPVNEAQDSRTISIVSVNVDRLTSYKLRSIEEYALTADTNQQTPNHWPSPRHYSKSAPTNTTKTPKTSDYEPTTLKEHEQNAVSRGRKISIQTKIRNQRHTIGTSHCADES
eukprot:augustus_masked-scaffold_34-processed-gene-2.35-mRNA-1 protein AED:1.00 eAED:1.00 QI:0/0/0/0/1/1/2/0/123